MTDQEPAGIYQEKEDYRGGLVYTQEYGYKTVTMTVSVAANEQSHVISHAHNLPVAEEPEHVQGVDLYHFAVIDGTQIQLTLETPAGNKEAWYTIHPDTIVAEPSPVAMDIVRSDESVPYEHASTQEALDEALTYYADHMPHWLNESPRSSPDHDRSDFGR
jgi:hypothetical protein